MEQKEKQIVLVREKTKDSIIQDIVSFGAILFSFWFNYKFIGGNDALDILLFIVFFGMGLRSLKEYKLFLEDVKKLEEEKK